MEFQNGDLVRVRYATLNGDCIEFKGTVLDASDSKYLSVELPNRTRANVYRNECILLKSNNGRLKQTELLDKSKGGSRPGAGRKTPASKWKHSKTKIVRIPEALEPRILTIAHELDADPSQTLAVLPELADLIDAILHDPEVTRGGRDRASVKRGLDKLLDSLKNLKTL